MVSVVPETTEAVSRNGVRGPGHGSPRVRREIFDALHLKAGKFWICKSFNLKASEIKYKVSVGKYLIWVASALLGYGIFNLMIMKNHLDMKDEHSELEDFYGISGKFLSWDEQGLPERQC